MLPLDHPDRIQITFDGENCETPSVDHLQLKAIRRTTDLVFAYRAFPH